MLALYRSGRPAEALRAYQAFGRVLDDEIGLEPSAQLAALDRQILAQDPALRLPVPTGRPLRGYRLGEPIGTGPWGSEYRAVQPTMNREVAIKVLPAELADASDFIRGFEANAQRVAGLESPHGSSLGWNPETMPA